PTIIGGEKLSTSFRTGPDGKGMFAACDLNAIDATEIPTAIRASATQVATRAQGSDCRAATSAATMAVRPITTWPHPETAVKVTARSITPRIKLRLSMARACISGGSDRRGRRGSTGAMVYTLIKGAITSKYFVTQRYLRVGREDRSPGTSLPMPRRRVHRQSFFRRSGTQLFCLE